MATTRVEISLTLDLATGNGRRRDSALSDREIGRAQRRREKSELKCLFGEGDEGTIVAKSRKRKKDDDEASTEKPKTKKTKEEDDEASAATSSKKQRTKKTNRVMTEKEWLKWYDDLHARQQAKDKAEAEQSAVDDESPSSA
jgi:hypothetical protein